MVSLALGITFTTKKKRHRSPNLSPFFIKAKAFPETPNKPVYVFLKKISQGATVTAV